MWLKLTSAVTGDDMWCNLDHVTLIRRREREHRGSHLFFVNEGEDPVTAVETIEEISQKAGLTRWDAGVRDG